MVDSDYPDSIDYWRVRRLPPEKIREGLRKTKDIHKRLGIYSARRLIVAKLREKGLSLSDAVRVSHGNEVKIAIMNSGLDTAHNEIARRFNLDKKGQNFVDWVKNYDADDISSFLSHCLGVAGILSSRKFGIVKRASLYSLKVCDDRKHGEQSAILEGLRHAQELGFDLVNMSLGQVKYEEFTTDNLYKLCRDFGEECVLVASAGNQGAGPSIPSSFLNVISVAATECSKEDSGYHTACSFTNVWPTVDIAAPGKDIPCIDIKRLGEKDYSESYGVMSGTSAAAPIITGIMAMAIAYLKKRNEIRRKRGQDEQQANPLELEVLLKDTACTNERRVFGFEHYDSDIQQVFGGYYGFEGVNPTISAMRFKSFVLGSGRVDAERFIRKLIDKYD